VRMMNEFHSRLTFYIYRIHLNYTILKMDSGGDSDLRLGPEGAYWQFVIYNSSSLIKIVERKLEVNSVA